MELLVLMSTRKAPGCFSITLSSPPPDACCADEEAGSVWGLAWAWEGAEPGSEQGDQLRQDKHCRLQLARFLSHHSPMKRPLCALLSSEKWVLPLPSFPNVRGLHNRWCR